MSQNTSIIIHVHTVYQIACTKFVFITLLMVHNTLYIIFSIQVHEFGRLEEGYNVIL